MEDKEREFRKQLARLRLDIESLIGFGAVLGDEYAKYQEEWKKFVDYKARFLRVHRITRDRYNAYKILLNKVTVRIDLMEKKLDLGQAFIADTFDINQAIKARKQKLTRQRVTRHRNKKRKLKEQAKWNVEPVPTLNEESLMKESSEEPSLVSLPKDSI